MIMTRHIVGAAVIAAAMLGPTPALAASSASMTSKALLLKPLTLTKLKDLDFGDIVPSGTGDFVSIDADTGARTTDKATLLISNPGKRAEFASSGVNNVLVGLVLSAPGDLVNAAGDKLKVTRLTLDQNNFPVRLLTPTSQVFFVGIGGDVYVRPDQEDGDYTGTSTLTAVYY